MHLASERFKIERKFYYVHDEKRLVTQILCEGGETENT